MAKDVEMWNWRYRSKIDGKLVTTRHKMTAEQAAKFAADAMPVAHTREVRQMLETPEEWTKIQTGQPRDRRD